MSKYKSKELAELLEGKLHADEDILICGIGDTNSAGTGKVVCLHNENAIEKELPEADLYITDEGSKLTSKPTITVKDARIAFISLLNLFNPFKNNGAKNFISQNSSIHPSVSIGKNCVIHSNVEISADSKIGSECKFYPNVFINENVSIGDRVTLKPGVIIEKGVIIGNDVTIHSGSVIGSDGFGYFNINGKLEKIPQIGNVVIEDNVEIGANVCIDRATLNSTLIKSGTKIDNLVQIGHNTEIGNSSIIVSQAGVSGSCKVGNECIIAGQAGLSDHVSIGNGTVVLSKTGVSKSFTKNNQMLFGIPAREAHSMWRILAACAKLPDLKKRINKIEKEIKDIKQIKENE